jgi:Straboviridae baseplate wedge protein Gp6
MKTYLAGQDKIRDYDFEGSNIAILLDLMAWNSHLNAHYLNMIGSEMWVDTAQLRDSMFSHAKELNYVPRSKTSSIATVSLSVDVGNASPTSVTIPKYTRVRSEVTDDAGDTTRYDFMTYEDVIVRPDALGNFVVDEVDVYEGRLVREVFTVAADTKFVLQSANCDVSSIRVNVQASSVNFANSDYSRSLNLYGVQAADEVFFVQGAYDGRYELVFGDGIIGAELETGNLVKITYRDSSGEAPNGSSTFVAIDDAEGYAITVTDVPQVAYGGAEEEDLDSIRFNAPRHFATQERAVVKSDYVTLVREKFPQLQAVAVYGGEEVTPKRYGKVIITAKPSGAEVVSDRLKADIVDFMSGKNIVTEPVMVDAEFLYVVIDCSVKYDGDVTDKTDTQIEAVVQDAITEFTADNLDDFGVSLRTSKLFAAIDDADESILSNDTRVTIEKRWAPSTGSTKSTVFTFGNELRDGIRERDLTSHDPIVWTSEFVYRTGGVNYDCYVKDDGDGVLAMFAVEDDGSELLLVDEVGTVDYETGDVALSINAYSYDTYVRVYGAPQDSDVDVRANLFLSTSTITVTAESV